MRPIYHHVADRVRAHIFVASLAFLLDRALEKKLKAAALDISSKEAWQLLKTVRVVEIDLGDGQCKRSVTQGSARAAHILKVLGITDLDPAALGPEAGGLETHRKRRSFVFNMLRALTANMG